MADVVRFFMGPEDERALFRELASLDLELYPEVVPPDWKPPHVEESLAATLDEPSYYLGAPSCGDITVDKVKRGPNKGKWMILEVISPVIHYQRSLPDPDDKVLYSGRVWAELHVSGDAQKRVQKPPQFEKLYRKVGEIIARRARKSQPVGWLVLPDAVKLHEKGFELRDEGRKGAVIRPFR